MKKLVLIGIGLVSAGAFVGFDAVHAFVDQTRGSVRASLMTPEMELQAKMSEARELGEKCAASVIDGRVALARLDSMIRERGSDLSRRESVLQRDRVVLETRRALLAENRPSYRIRDEEVPRRALDRDALLRAKAYATDREICGHLKLSLEELTLQRERTAAEIEEATAEQARLETEIGALKAELENLKARRAVARTREEAAYVFDRSTFDRAREKVAEIRATISEQNKRLDFYGRGAVAGRGILPADEPDAPEESGAAAIEEIFRAEATLPR